MDFIISLAHFCEVHGPTSILCTQLSRISCPTCFPCGTPPSEDTSKNSSYSSNSWEPKSPSADSSQQQPLLYSPPTSPRTPNSSYNPYFGAAPGDRQQSLRYSVSSDAEYDACDNCTFLVPKDMSEQLPDGAPGSPTKDGRGRHGFPILRTTQAVLAYGRASCLNDGEEEDDRNRKEPRASSLPDNGAQHPTASGKNSPERSLESGASSPMTIPSSTHTHFITYVTTRQPSSPDAYSLLRRSCIRTLSCENLPRGSPSGPLYFGDSIAGYTIAYVFRLPDPRARGRRRTYALIALGGRDSWKVSNVMVSVTKMFESIANQIVAMADRVLERESATPLPSLSSTASPTISPVLSSSDPVPCEGSRDDQQPAPASPEKPRSKSVTNPPTAAVRNLSDVSSFLSAKKVDPDGYPRVSREVMRAKGLAEIVGKENFFVELHARFCMILAQLVRDSGR